MILVPILMVTLLILGYVYINKNYGGGPLFFLKTPMEGEINN